MAPSKPRRRGRDGGVLIEFVLVVSIVALSALILAAVTGYASEVAGEYSEMGTEVNALGDPITVIPQTDTPTILFPGTTFPFPATLPIVGNAEPGSTVTITLDGGMPGVTTAGGGGAYFLGGFFFSSGSHSIVVTALAAGESVSNPALRTTVVP